jgi:hypothetical protein
MYLVPRNSGVGYSARNASVGFRDAARHAGKKLATNDASPKSAATLVNVKASHARTPKSRLRITMEVPAEQASPIASPAIVNNPACRITSL